MKKAQQFVYLLLILLTFGSAVQASHFIGAAITYSSLNSCTTRVHITTYRDCNGAQFMSANVNWIPIGPGCTAPPAIQPTWSNYVRTDITPICPTSTTACTLLGSPISGVEQMYAFRDFDICAVPGCEFNLEWIDCCRNGAVTGFPNASADPAFVTSQINTAIAPANSSPQFLGLPVAYIPAGQPTTISWAAVDPDGDSLSYQFATCLKGSSTPVGYAPGYSSTTPMGSTWNVSLDPQSGTITFLPNPGNIVVGVICVTVSEWRNGVQIGQIMRDFQVTVITSPTNTAPVFSGITNVSPGVSLSGSSLFMCSPTAFCFDVSMTDVNPGQNLSITWSQNLAGATFTDANNPMVQNTILGTSAAPPVGRFCWTPPGNGHYTVKFRYTDDACPLNGLTEYAVNIQVGGIPQASATAGTCPNVQFSASPCGPGNYTYAWSGAGGFSSTSQNPTFAFGAPGSYPWQVVISNGVTSDTLRDTVIVSAAPAHASIFSGIHSIAPCIGNLYDTLNAGAWSSYQWNTGATTSSLVTFMGGLYSVTVTDANGCMYYDSTEVLWSEPDIYGIVTTSLNTPLQNQRILLIKHDTAQQALLAVDSTWTDSMGFYFFCNVTDTITLLKATPLQVDYPMEMPTYADTSAFWSGAISFYPQVQSPFRHDFSTLAGVNPGGSGFIGGLIVQGANKTTGVGDPIVGLQIFLRDRLTGELLGSQRTNILGRFSFPNIPMGEYEIVPDLMPVSTTNVPVISVNVQDPIQDSLLLHLHSTWLELVSTGVSVTNPDLQFSISAQPNPFSSSMTLALDLSEKMTGEMTIHNAMGQKMAVRDLSALNIGTHRFEVGNTWPSGIYFVKLNIPGHERTLKVVKQ